MRLENNPLVIIGKLGKPFGIKGWLKVYSYTQPFQNIFKYTPWIIKENHQYREFTYENYEIHHKNLIVKFSAFNTPETAKQLTNCNVAIHRTQLPVLSENEYYWSDLQNLQVITTTGVALGHVDHFFQTAAHPVMVIKDKKEYLVPFVMGKIIKEIKLDKGILLIEWDANFLEL